MKERASGVNFFASIILYKMVVMQALNIVYYHVEPHHLSLCGEGENNIWQTILTMLACKSVFACFKLT